MRKYLRSVLVYWNFGAGPQISGEVLHSVNATTYQYIDHRAEGKGTLAASKQSRYADFQILFSDVSRLDLIQLSQTQKSVYDGSSIQ